MNKDQTAIDWWRTTEAHDVVEKLKAATFEAKLYTQQAQRIEKSGTIIAIVPNLENDTSSEAVSTWEKSEPKSYKWRIIDNKAEALDEGLPRLDINCNKPDGLATVRDLDGRPLAFKTDFRPRARHCIIANLNCQQFPAPLPMLWPVV